jgi:SAM-dependent methyltransferase
MRGTPPLDKAPADYRQSHVVKGSDYDASLAATPFDDYMATWEAHWLRYFIRRHYPQGVARYLDFACGTGRITKIIAPYARESIGVDVSPSMLDVARAKCPSTTFVQADLTRERHDIGRFDLITSFRFFGNAQNELRSAALEVIATLLRPGGRLLLNNHRNPLSIAELLYRGTGGNRQLDLSYFKLARMLEEHRLQLETTRAIGFWMFRSSLLMRANASVMATRLERAFSSRIFAPFSPDAVVVATKAG